MAMDKEQLLSWFQAHYLSRQEVLYKLPLNLSIDSFWADLLNRRKAGATVLPLYNASGMPYWYVLTEKMITASERLCEEAMAQDGAFDPYRTQMTSAMTEEMFFTSFVEGAQIPLQQAMDFLQRGTEPEDIQEQMIWNNRHAWAEMTATLYRPLDEGFIKALAFMLTEEMDGCAQDYRQTDNHPIAAMGSEPYDVPPSYTLPDRMREYCAFLSQPDIHPLIKSAVAQAYILVARPFPEGNERLSRMLSSAVLLRCGYDFFRDISLSAVIARENYRYYKAMKEILRPENGGDLTYFVEYFLELLVRAVNAQKERLRRREQEALEKEREMAGQPLNSTVGYQTQPPHSENQAEKAQPVEVVKSSSNDDCHNTSQADNATASGDNDSAEEPFWPEEQFWSEVNKRFDPRDHRVRQIPQRIHNMISDGIYSFTLAQYAEKNQLTLKGAAAACRRLFQEGLLIRDYDLKRNVLYTFRIEKPEAPEPEDNTQPGNQLNLSEALLSRLKDMKESGEATKRRIARFFLSLAAEGKTSFSFGEWKSFFNMSKSACAGDIRSALCLGLIEHRTIGDKSLPGLYRIKIDACESLRITDLTIADKYYLACIYSSCAMNRFTAEQCSSVTSMSRKRAHEYLDRLCERGIVAKDKPLINRPGVFRLLISPTDYPDCFQSTEQRPTQTKARTEGKTFTAIAI